MLIARALVAAIKPILLGGAVTASAATGVAVWQYTDSDDSTTFERLQSAGTRLIVSEFGVDADTIVAIDPRDPGVREEIATVDHAPEWGIFASLAPDGDAIAYTALPADAVEPSPDTPAIAGVVDANGDVQVLATDVDLLIAPVWSPDGESIVVRKNTPVEDAADAGAGSFELIVLGRDGSRSTITSWRSAAVFPIAFSPDGARLYFATLSVEGADLYRVAPDGADETLIAHLSDDIARGWRLSPDGSSLAYSAFDPASGTADTMVLDLNTGIASAALATTQLPEYSAAWSADGALTIGAVVGAGSIALSVDAGGGVTTVTGKRGAIDLPLSWSHDGSTLALQSMEGLSALDAGAGRLELIYGNGDRAAISSGPDMTVVGWLE